MILKDLTYLEFFNFYKLLKNNYYDKLILKRKGWMASFAVLVFLVFAGIDYGTQPGAEFNELETALENAIAGSGGSNLMYVYQTIVVCGDNGCDDFDVCRYGPGFC